MTKPPSLTTPTAKSPPRGDYFSHYAYTYTGQGDVALVDNAGTPGVPDVLLASQFDAAGNRKSVSATIGGVKDFLTSYSYNTLSQLDEIDQQRQSGGNAVAMKSIYFGLDAIGEVTQIDRSNSVFAGPQQNGPAYSLLSYNPTTGLLAGINHEYMGASLDNLTYTRDALGRVVTFGSIDGTAWHSLRSAQSTPWIRRKNKISSNRARRTF